MSMASIHRAANDPQLQARLLAAAMRELNYSDDLAETQYGRQLRQGVQNVTPLMWPIAVDTEAAYETALTAGRGAPGHDQDVITDDTLTSAVVTHWPYTPEEQAGREPFATFVTAGMQGQVTVAQGTPSATYTVEWGDGGGAGALPLDASGGAFAGHDYADAGEYSVRVLDDAGAEIAGSTTLTIVVP